MKSTKPIIIFDLDDTLFNELDYLKSAYSEIAKLISKDPQEDYQNILDKMLTFYDDKVNVFVEILNQYNSSKKTSDLLDIYRNHEPKIELLEGRKTILDYLKSNGFKMGLLTDGRSIQQRNKIKALEIEDYFNEIIISEEFGSEKPNKNNFLHFEKQFGSGTYFYIGDNLSKDFITPNALGWTTICILDNGNNIHKQNFRLDKAYLPEFTIKDFDDLKRMIG